MTEASALHIGIDGGGTRARVVAIDGAGREVARVDGGPALLSPEEPAMLAEPLAALARRALGGAAASAASLCCALAGAGRAAERAVLRAALISTGVARHVLVTTDAEAALHDAFGGAAGILLVAGTGSVAWGRGPDGRTARAGGWGALLGDEGSGYAIGLAALRAVMRAHDGRAPATVLRDVACAHAGVDDAAALIAWAVAAEKRTVAALAPAVIASATGTQPADPAAAAIVAAAATALAELVVAVHSELMPWPHAAPLALAGGLLAADGPLRAAVLAALEPIAGRVTVVDVRVDAARGAAALARAAAGA